MHKHGFTRLLWCALGMISGISLSLFLIAPPVSSFLLASPRALFGGHLGGALVGIACYQVFGDALWVYAVAQALALWLMLLTKTVHPPAGANPVIMIFGHAGFAALWQPVFVGVLSLAVVTIVWSRLYPGLVHYPVSWAEPSPSRTLWGGWDV
jgi:CBS-domain-containing membrane protein